MGAASTAAVVTVAALLASVAIETVGHPLRGVDRRPAVMTMRGAAVLMLLLFWFSVSWRPLLAGMATVVTVGVLRVVSEKKRGLVGEPVVFSDFALLGQVLRYPDLYYLDARALIAVAAVAAPVAAWMWVEPASLPRQAGPAAAALVLLPALQVALALAAARPAAAAARRLVPVPALARDEARLGLLLTLLAYLFRWSDLRRGPVPAAAVAEEGVLAPPPRTVVVVQMESFVDPATLPGGRTGPGLLRARREASRWGALHVPGHGAYTMRSEFAALTGLEPDEISFEGFDPYLSAATRPFATLASALRARRYRTVFVHPFRRGFFGRDRIMPALGFERLVMEDDFEGAVRIGHHVCDEAVAERVLAEVDRADGPVLVFAATMQNHGPWTVPLSPDPGTPLERYRRHLDDADWMIGLLLDGLASRGEPALLCVYGDHPPILRALGAPSDRPATTYAVVPVGFERSRDGPEPAPQDLTVAGLGRTLRALAGG